MAAKKKTRVKTPAPAEPLADAPVHTDRSNNELRVGDLVSVPCIVRKITGRGDSTTLHTLELEPQLPLGETPRIRINHAHVDLISRGH